MSLDKAIEHGKKSESRIVGARQLTGLAATTGAVSGAKETGRTRCGTSTRQRRASDV